MASILRQQVFSCKGKVWRPKVVLLLGTLNRSTSRISKSQVTLNRDIPSFSLSKIRRKPALPRANGRESCATCLLPSLDQEHFFLPGVRLLGSVSVFLF